MKLLNDSWSTVAASESAIHKAHRTFQNALLDIWKRTDRLVALLMCLQWPGAILASLFISTQADPRSATASGVQAHPHLIAAIYLGGLLTLPSALLALLRPGETYTRHTIAACQMLMSGLLIMVSSGRIETHFHVFASLALLAFYLEWRVLATATLVTLIHHAAIGWFTPASIYGPAAGSAYRFPEHVIGIFFFNLILVTSCRQGLKALRSAAKREADQEILLYQAYHDALTGLGNRLQIQKTMTEMLGGSRRNDNKFALMAIDLDRFKEVNDTLGHQVGDQVLMQASRRLQEQIRQNDTLVRMGGDEFAIVLEGCDDVKLAETIGRRILESMEAPFLCGSHVIRVGASIGICMHEEQGTVSEDIFHHADLALYQAKNGGRNALVVFDEKMGTELVQRNGFERRLRTAVAEQALELHYQPIVDRNGVLTGFEALLRWCDPVFGWIEPSEFIPLAEKTGVILPLGTWVLQKACAQAALWRRGGVTPVKMSVNVSSLQLADANFIATVLTVLKETGLPPELLDLELTESTLIKNQGQTFRTLEFLRKFGVRLSIDDFGTGYSSLSYLRELPVHALKIDRAFMKDIVASSEARLLVQGMVEMAHSLHLRVVAEGVETKEQMDILIRAGCDEIQGMHISSAVSANEAGLMIYLRAGVQSQEATAEPQALSRLVAAFHE